MLGGESQPGGIGQELHRIGLIILVLVVTIGLVVSPVGAVVTGAGHATAPNTEGERATALTTDEITGQVSTGEALYRANAGGSFTSDGTTWDPLIDYMVAGQDQTSSHGQPSTIDSSVPTGTPTQIWETERWDPVESPEMGYEFAVPQGQEVEVRLYFYDGYTGTDSVGDRVFDVSIEGQTVLDNFDIIEKYGDDTGAMESFVVTSDGTIDVDFGHVTENPQINAIEIVSTEAQPDELGASPSSVDFGTVVTGNSATEAVTLTNLGDAANSSHPDITITDVSISGSDPGQFSHDFSGSPTLGPEESAEVNVTYSPSDAQAHAATMEVTHSGTNSPITVDLAGEGSSDVPIGFGSSELQGFTQGSLTALEFGPDGRLYVAQQDGSIFALEIERTGDNTYSVVNQESTETIKEIPNHDDDGSLNTGESNRQVTGLTVGGTASDPIVYVTSSDPRIGGGGSGTELDLDTNSGAISRLTFDWSSDGTSATVDHEVMVLGLPRSEENHAPNGLDLSDDGDTLYLAQGGNTNKGAPSNNFAYTPEYALSSAALSIDLAQIESNFAAKNLQNYSPPTGTGSYPDLSFYYAIPTIQTDDGTDGDDLPFGGQDGVNMAKWVEGGPVQVYSSGYRNPYDLVLSEDDQLYVIDNGPNGGWGGQPVDADGNIVQSGETDCTNAPSESGDYGTGDQLHLATQGSYGGHAVPIRGNPTGADIYDENGTMVFDITSSNSPVPSSLVNPVECDYQDPSEDNSIGDEFGWTGGIDEYTASNFGGAMQGDLLVVTGASNVERVELNATGTGVTNQEGSFLTPGTALGIAAQGDGGPFPGTIWTARGDLIVHEPNDYDGSVSQCTGADDPSLDEDGDGYDNADEIDANTDPCSAASTPPDFDGDGTSNLNDPDDDNDGLPDTSDPFAVDPDNGISTTLPVDDPLTATSLFGDDSQAWTGLMTNGQTDYQALYDPDQMTVGGAAGVLTVENVPTGDAVNNDQQNAFQFGAVAPDEPFTISTTVNGFPDNPANYQGMGITVGNGDQDNYAKLIVAANGGTGGIQFAKETGGSFTNIAQPDDSAVTGQSTNTDLQLTVDPTTDPAPNNGQDEVAVTAAYAVDGGQLTEVGTGAIPASWLDSSDGVAPAFGIISTSYQAGSTFDATWKDFTVETVAGPAVSADAGADQTADEGTQVTLDATASTGDSLSYEWTQTVGTSVTLSDSSSATPSFTAPEVAADETLTFEVNVTDGQTYDTDLVNVTVQDTDIAVGDVLHRVDAGNSADTGAIDAGPDWTGVTDTSSPYLASLTDGNTGNGTFCDGDVITPTDSVPSSTPDAVFDCELYGNMDWTFDVADGTDVEVRVYVGNQYPGTNQPGDRQFNVSIEGTQVLTQYDPVADVGHANGTMKSFTVTSDGTVDVSFEAGAVENPLVNALEIVAVGDNEAPTVDAIADQTVTEGDTTTVDVTASDPDGDALTLSTTGAPAFVSLADAGDGTGTLTISPSTGDAGTYEFDVVADDGQATGTESVNLTVTEAAATYGVETGMATDVQINTSTLTNASATMNGTLTLGDKSEATPYVKIWPEEQPEDAFWYSGSPMATSGEFDFDVVLSPSTTYVWKAFAQSSDGDWKAGANKTFTTPTGQYFGVTTNDPSSVGVEWVTLEGELVNLGDNDNATVYFTYWKQGEKSSTLTWWTGPVQSGSGAFSTQVQLDPNTTYEYRALGQSDEGEWKAGPVTTFTTQDGQPYGVETDPATNVADDSATLNGNLTGLGDYADATVYFQYWVEGQKASTLNWWTGSALSSPGEFSASVGLQANTTYEFQAYAQSNEAKWTAGTIQSLTTAEAGTNQPPTAALAVNDTAPTVGQPVAFDASASSDSDGTIASYGWDFDGDGTVDQTTASASTTHAYATAGEYTAQVTVTDDDGATDTASETVSVSEPAGPNASASILITPNGGLEASTYSSGAFEVTNTGEQNITSVELDLSSTSLPDMVFDPDGTAGDQAGKGLVIDGQSGDGVGVVSTADGDVFSQPHNGVNGSDGYDVLTIEFTDFDPGESVSFSADNDPTSIKNATITSQEAGPVSGLELGRATMTVGYDSVTQSTQVIGDGSQGGAEGVADDSVPAAPTIDVEGVALDSNALDAHHSAATVSDATQTVNVSGPAGSTVTLVQVEGELELSNVPTYDGTPGYEIEDYEANKAENVAYYSATVGASGTVSIPVTLTNSTDVGGYNYFVAHVEDSEGAGLGSNVAVLKLEEGTNTAPSIDAITDTGVTEGESTSVPVTASDADGDSLSLSVSGPSFVSLTDDGDGTGTVDIAPGSGTSGTHTVTVTASDGQASASEEFAVYVDEPVQGGDVVFAVNSGGSAYTAADATSYLADTNFTGGTSFSTGSAGTPSDPAIGNTQDDTLYQTERYGGSFGYDVGVPNGNYQVTLQFAEIYQGVSSNDSPDSDGPTDGTNENDRLFNASIEGQPVIWNYDIYSEVGPLNASDKTYAVEVTDGNLDIDFEAINDNAKISAIRVVNTSGGDTNTAPTIDAIADQTVIEGDTAQVPVSATDADGDSLTLTKSAGPSFVTLTDNGDGTGEVQIAPQSGDAGTYTVEVTADDGQATATESFTLTVEEPASGSASIAVTEGGGIDASTYSGGSFEVSNTGDTQITSVQFDVSESLIPDAVFDPNGTAGDTTAKELSIDSQSGDGVGVVSTSSADIFSQPHNGVDDDEGYDVMTIDFDDFDPGESVSFSIDLDPTTIKGASTTGGAGSISGLEIAGSEVTVGYADGATQSADLFGDGSDGGSAAAANESVASAPTLGVDTVTLQSTDFPAHEAATVGESSQTLTLDGPADATVELLHVEASEPPSDGYDIDPYEADNAQAVSYQTVTLDSSGQATVPVSLSESNLDYFVATVSDDDAGQTSNTVILDYNSSLGEPQVLHRVNAGESVTLTALDDGPDWTGVSGTGSPYLVSASGDNYCGGDITSTSAAVPSSTPDGVFDCERYGPSTWEFGVNANEEVEVRLYLGNQFDGASEPGDRAYNVSIEGQQVLTNYDPVADVGHATGTMKNFTVTDDGDGAISVAFEVGAAENPQVNAIEVLTT